MKDRITGKIAYTDPAARHRMETLGMTLALHGYRFSIYCWAVRLLLAEKGLDHTWHEIDPFDRNRPEAYLALHPFGRVPVLVHDDFTLYETAPILRYLDEAFPVPALQPAEPGTRARMNQIIAVADAYAYWPLVRQVFSNAVFAPAAGIEPDDSERRDGMAAAIRVLAAIEELAGDGSFLVGDTLSLADIHLAPMVASFAAAADGAALLARHRRLDRWLTRISRRPAFALTRPDLPRKGEA